MKKSSSNKPSLPKDVPLEIKYRAMVNEKNYWRTRYELLLKYGTLVPTLKRVNYENKLKEHRKRN